MGFNVNQGPQRQEFQLADYYRGLLSAGQNGSANALLYPSQLEYHHSYDLNQNVDALHNVFGYLPNMCPPPSAFLGPKCSLWDCTRPVQGFDHCSSLHFALALKEGSPGMTPILRPGGICLKDGLLFAVLNSKAQGKDVGVPECEGAASAKSPWNAPELFDLSVLEGENIREWLFFDKPRRAFERGNRKQRSLPDYNGRGWHESRKQVMNDFGGLKRSYYMDPQPLNAFEWHLYEYEINNFEACALYRLELKCVERKKCVKGKSPNDSLSDLQKQMGRLTADFPTDNKRSVKGRTKASEDDEGLGHGMGAVNDYLVADLKERALNRVDDLQGMFSDLQSARKESRSIKEVAVLEEQVHQMLKEWKSELNRPSPASSLQALNRPTRSITPPLPPAPARSASTVQCEIRVTVNASYAGDFVEFQLSASSGILELNRQVSRKLELTEGTYDISYRDEDDDLILLTCDEDLQFYISSSLKQENYTLTVFVMSKELDSTGESGILLTVKAKYGSDFVRFHLSSSSGIRELHCQVFQRLKLEVGTYLVKYQDDDNDWIIIACDEDLRNYISTSTSHENYTLKVSIEPKCASPMQFPKALVSPFN